MTLLIMLLLYCFMEANAKITDTPPILLSDEAREKIKALMAREKKGPEAALRVSVAGGGCSGYSYKMAFEDQPKEGDQSFVSNDVRIVLDSRSALFITGLRIHFEDGLNGAGFVYENPKAAKSCGCGTSFSV